MAEIKIEKKNSVWPWIVGIIILALLIYFLAFNDGKEENPVEDATEEVTSLNDFHLTDAAEVTIG
ncbi:MAG TPA: hypothetical protein VFG54_19885 [Prolixibacteraceae bacterium]|nr:hypothetical protein [Prolixibacteraceae bacterium]